MLNRFLKYLATWSASQLSIVSMLWVAVVVLAALQTPPVRYLFALYELAKMLGSVNADVPVVALRVIAIVTPIVALAPPITVFMLWRRVRDPKVVVRAA